MATVRLVFFTLRLLIEGPNYPKFGNLVGKQFLLVASMRQTSLPNSNRVSGKLSSCDHSSQRSS
jgi:hypothetical protein